MAWVRPDENPNWYGTGRPTMPPRNDSPSFSFPNADAYGGGGGGPPFPSRESSGALNGSPGTRGMHHHHHHHQNNNGGMTFPGPQGRGYGSPNNYTPPPGPPPMPPRPGGGYMSPPGPPPSNSGYPGQEWRGGPSVGVDSMMYHTSPGSAFNSYGSPSGPPPMGGDFPYMSPGEPHMPPSQMQFYGPDMTTPGGQQQQPQFMYSQCNGRKKALIVGINYIGTDQALGGCINDANRMKAFIMRMFNYTDEDIVILTDDARSPESQPTRANILRAMGWLVRNAAPNDSLFFHYSGHGGLTKDTNGDEEDGFDEVIYPMDFKSAGHIVDDMMHDIIVRPLPAGCRLTAIFDSCHSGSALDLPYVYSTEGKVKEPNLMAEAGSSLLGVGMSYLRKDYGGMFKAAKGLVGAASGRQGKAEELSRRTKSSPADVISWSGCKDSQTSADTEVGGQGTGAMSWAFMESLNRNPRQSFQQLLVSIRRLLRDKYSQKPQLSSSHPMDTNIVFIA